MKPRTKNAAPFATTQIEFVDSAYNEEAYENGAYIFTEKKYTSPVFTRTYFLFNLCGDFILPFFLLFVNTFLQSKKASP